MKKLIAAVGLIAALSLTGCFSTQVKTPDADSVTSEQKTEAEEAPAQGTRANPVPIGSVIEEGDWAVTINSVTLDATQAILDANMINEAPAEGETYVLVNITIQYNGTDPDGRMPWAGVDFVTAEGNTVNSYDRLIIPPEQLDSTSTLYEGASTTGNLAFAVPSASAAEGALAVTANLGGNKVFVAVQ